MATATSATLHLPNTEPKNCRRAVRCAKAQDQDKRLLWLRNFCCHFARAIALVTATYSFHPSAASWARSRPKSFIPDTLANTEISVGQVAVIFAVRFLFPKAIVLVLVCLIGNQHSTVTRSMARGQIHDSQWPILMESYTTTSRGVYSSLNRMAWLRQLVVSSLPLLRL